MSKQMAPLSLRLSRLQKEKLYEAALKLGISPHALAQLAIQAGISAVEKFDGMVFPPEFDLLPKRVPAARGHYPTHGAMRLNEEVSSTKPGASGPGALIGEELGKFAPPPLKKVKRAKRTSGGQSHDSSSSSDKPET